jgi:amidophosphoribosyltransferase
MESEIPYRRVLIKYTPGYGRSYTPLSQELRDRIALMKLIANEAIAKGNRIVLCEDSIVRGTQLKNYTITKLMQAGAKEVHVRPACPPLMFPCVFNLSTRSIQELVARRAIRALEGKDIGATSLKYQLLDDMVKAIGLPKEKLCLYCWIGKGVQKSLQYYQKLN